MISGVKASEAGYFAVTRHRTVVRRLADAVWLGIGSWMRMKT